MTQQKTTILSHWTPYVHLDFARTVVREGRIPFEVSSHKTAPLIAASASQMLRIMQALSSEAQEAGVADMSLDEINAEIDAARKGI